MASVNVKLSEYLHAVRDWADATPGAQVWPRYLLVEAASERVLCVYIDLDIARSDIQLRFDADPCEVDRLELIVADHEGTATKEWPDGSFAEGRAQALAAGLSELGRELSDDELLDEVRRCYLRGDLGTLTVDGKPTRVVALWWMSASEPRRDVGFVAEQRPGRFELMLAIGQLGERWAHAQVAAALTCAGLGRWQPEEVTAVAIELTFEVQPPSSHGVIPAGVCAFALDVLRRCGLLPSNGTHP